MVKFLEKHWIAVVCAGRNESGQLGLSDVNRRDAPTLVPCLEGLNIVQAACGKGHTLFLTG